MWVDRDHAVNGNAIGGIRKARTATVVRSGAWALVDQAFGSLTSATVAIAVARTASPSAFGAFSLAFTAYLICYGFEPERRARRS